MNVQIEAKLPGSPEKLKKARHNQRLIEKKREEMRKAGCSCDLSPGYSSTDPMCPLHGLPAYRRDNDRR